MRVSSLTGSESLCNWIFRYADFGIILTDTELRITDVNRWIENHSGKQSHALKGKNILDMFPEIVKRGNDRHLADALNGASVILSSTFHSHFIELMIEFDSKKVPMKQTTRITPLLNTDSVYGLIIHIEDVTERIHREELLERKNDELQKINATKDKFFSIISHDLRSPFNALLGFSEMLKDDASIIQEKTRFLVNSLHAAIKNQFQFLENLLKWAQIQSGKLELNFTEVKLGEIISQVLRVALPVSNSKNISISALCIPEDIRLFTDSQGLTSVLYNLVFNAIKFTNQGGYVRIRAEQSGESTVISVEDNGIGLDPGKIDKLFRIDEPVSTPGTNREKGSGIGLILVKEIVEHLGGTINVESTPGEGSVFTVSLRNRD
jgi:two-component system, sensor histidine kinase and response regulator